MRGLEFIVQSAGEVLVGLVMDVGFVFGLGSHASALCGLPCPQSSF